MAGMFRVDDYTDLLLPGTPADYLDTAVLEPETRTLLNERQVMLEILRDRTPLPTTAAREGYYGNRHLEYWLSGRRDMGKVVEATRLDRVAEPRILDFGGASGRVIRHFRDWKPGVQCFLCDIDPQHVMLAKQLFGSSVAVFRNHGLPTLPFPDAFFDCIVAFSVFTHIDADDTAWLLELRRITRAGGRLYLTVHDQATWEALPQTAMAGRSFSNPEFELYHKKHAELRGRVVHTYSEAADYQCNVFLGRDYIDEIWAPLFETCSILPLAHHHQAAIVLEA
jgi:SAM-dependent methyltransferase